MVFRIIKERKGTGDKKIFGTESYYLAKQIHNALENNPTDYLILVLFCLNFFYMVEKMKILNNKQKTAICLIQDVFSKLELNNLEVSDIMTYCTNKEESFSLFRFITGHYLQNKEIEREVMKYRNKL